jgi:hypothetical protein
VALAAQAAQAVRHGSSCDFQLWTGPNSDFFSNQKIFIAFGFILTKHLVKSRPEKRRDFMAFYGSHCILCVKINPPTFKYAFQWGSKNEKKWKNNIVNYG